MLTGYPQVESVVFLLIAVFFSCLAVGMAIQAVRIAKSASAVAWRRKCNQLEAAIADAEVTQERLSQAVRKLQMRKVTETRLAKQQKPEIPDPQTDPAGWKKHMRERMHNGTFHGGATG